MTPERWQQVKEVLHTALDLPAAERSAWLNTHCEGQPDLLAEVNALLASHEEAEDFLEEPILGSRVPDPETLSDSDPVIGQRIGPYRLTKQIAQGGMGTVYAALREDGEFTMRVAIKVVKRGMDTDLILQRFRLERQILAQLSHPNIAHLLDGGVTPDGRPYFVLEFIEGTPIDEHCRRAHCTLEEKLQLFQSVCAAVQYAHRSLVVHSDLKAGNILVTPEGSPKLLDFGIARMIDADILGRSTKAFTEVRAMTPAYASPEQLRGESVTTASDVYSLGVLLYEILSGAAPYNFENKTPEGVLRELERTTPRKPSDVSGNKILAGDLDNIVAKAMQHDPLRRYFSVEAFAEDIRRHQEGMPVLARPDTVTYRVGKFVRRHTTMVGIAATLLISLVGGVIATTWQARVAREERARAERRFADVRKLASSLIFEMDEEISKLPGSTGVRGTLTKRSIEYLDSLAAEAGEDRNLLLDLASAYQKLGDIQGRPNSSNLGRTADAIESYRKALAIRERLSARGKKDSQQKLMLATNYVRLSEVLKVTGDYRAGVEFDQKALKLREDLLSENPYDVASRRAVGQSYTALGGSLAQVGEWDACLNARRQAVDIFTDLLRLDPKNDEDRRNLALAESRMGGILQRNKDLKGALEHYNKALELERGMYSQNPANVQRRLALAQVELAIGGAYFDLKNYNEALASYGRALLAHTEISNADPNDARTRSLLASSHYRIGSTYVSLNSGDKALPYLERALAIRHELSEANPMNAGARGQVAESYASLGDCQFALRNLKQAAAWYARSLQLFSELKQHNQLNANTLAEMERVSAQLEKLK